MPRHSLRPSQILTASPKTRVLGWWCDLVPLVTGLAREDPEFHFQNSKRKKIFIKYRNITHTTTHIHTRRGFHFLFISPFLCLKEQRSLLVTQNQETWPKINDDPQVLRAPRPQQARARITPQDASQGLLSLWLLQDHGWCTRMGPRVSGWLSHFSRAMGTCQEGKAEEPRLCLSGRALISSARGSGCHPQITKFPQGFWDHRECLKQPSQTHYNNKVPTILLLRGRLRGSKEWASFTQSYTVGKRKAVAWTLNLGLLVFKLCSIPTRRALLLLWPENQLFRGWRKWAGSLCLSIQPDKSEQAGFWLTHTCVSLHIPEGPLSQAWVLEVKPQELLTVCDSGLPFSFAHSAVCTIGSSEQVPPGITVKGKPKNRLSTLHSQQY